MALRQWVVSVFGGGIARRIEQFVDGTIFGDDFLVCPNCKANVAAALMAEWRVCPVCHLPTTEDLTDEALQARRQAALAAAAEAQREAEEIEQQITARRKP